MGRLRPKNTKTGLNRGLVHTDSSTVLNICTALTYFRSLHWHQHSRTWFSSSDKQSNVIEAWWYFGQSNISKCISLVEFLGTGRFQGTAGAPGNRNLVGPTSYLGPPVRSVTFQFLSTTYCCVLFLIMSSKSWFCHKKQPCIIFHYLTGHNTTNTAPRIVTAQCYLQSWDGLERVKEHYSKTETTNNCKYVDYIQSCGC